MSDTPYFTCGFQMRLRRAAVARRVCVLQSSARWMSEGPKGQKQCWITEVRQGDLGEKINSNDPVLNPLNIPMRWPRSRDAARAVMNAVLCTLTLSFQVLEKVHQPLILSNNLFIILSLSSFAANWSNLSSELFLCIVPDTLHHCFPIHLFSLVPSDALYKQAGCLDLNLLN